MFMCAGRTTNKGSILGRIISPAARMMNGVGCRDSDCRGLCGRAEATLDKRTATGPS